MENNKLINLDFADGMLEAIMQKFKKINEIGNSVPETDQPHMQLVTDVDGNPRWSYTPIIGEAITIKHHESMEKTQADQPGTWCKDGSPYSALNGIGGLAKVSDYVPTMEELFSDAVTFKCKNQSTGEDIDWHEDRKYILSDGTYGRWDMTLYNAYKNPDSEDGSWPLVWVVPKPTQVLRYVAAGSEVYMDCYEPGVYMWVASYGKKSGRVEFTYYHGIPLDKSVPVIQTASVGQTIVVKSVDENGKPTEWEAVDGDFDTRKQIVIMPAFDEMGENPREEDKVSDESITYGYSNNNRDLTWTLKPLQPDEVANIVQSNLDEYVLVLKGEKYEDWFANRLSTSRDFFVFERKPYLQTEWVNVGEGTSLAFVVSERILLYLTGEDAGKMVLQVNSRTVYDASM